VNSDPAANVAACFHFDDRPPSGLRMTYAVHPKGQLCADPEACNAPRRELLDLLYEPGSCSMCGHAGCDVYWPRKGGRQQGICLRCLREVAREVASEQIRQEG